jgi:hypothetical protein
VKLKAKVLIQTLSPLYHFDFDNPAIKTLVRAYLMVWLAGLDPKDGHRPATCRTNRILHLQRIAILRVGHACLP